MFPLIMRDDNPDPEDRKRRIRKNQYAKDDKGIFIPAYAMVMRVLGLLLTPMSVESVIECEVARAAPESKGPSPEVTR